MRRLVLTLLVMVVFPASVLAQNWSLDARQIALGAMGGTRNLATDMIEDERPYSSIIIPLGLVQVLSNSERMNPASEQFDIVRTIEYAIAPVHYVVGRNSSITGDEFVVDLRNALLNRDLNAYRGFLPATQPASGGLAAPTIGGGISVYANPNGAFQRVFIGAGPYVALRGALTTDESLTRILGSSAPVYVPNAHMQLTSGTEIQTAMSATLGYRALFPWPEGFSAHGEREGVYVAFNYNFIGGFRYENIGTSLRLDTDAGGLLTLNPFLGAPLVVTRDTAGSGRGRAIDVGVGAVIGKWEMGVGANGIANHITWSGVERTSYSIGNLLSGNSNFIQSATNRLGDIDVVLPVDVRGDLAYHEANWSALTAVGRGFNGVTFHAGYERRLGHAALRVGAFHSNGSWEPTGGVGLPLGERVAVDLAAYGTSANIERERHIAVAVSVRVNARTLQPVRSR